ncbi:MAG: MBOAT family protein [Schleiferiaceae bacterium]|nr:MBOAT family protein [Schleiferiaceae bacterium]
MLFNSLDFAIFLPIVFLLYWFAVGKNLKWQNALIVIASYFFYGVWDWRFLGLIAFSTLVDFWVSNQLETQVEKGRRKRLLWLSIAVNLGFLGFFKYFNFFAENFAEAFTLMGMPFKASTLKIVLPVGISFYTFQTMSYTIDVYRGKLKATKDFVAFAAYVSFFPQLVAGPIERATNLLPQFTRQRKFDYNQATNGCRQILWGFFKKLVIADNFAVYANEIFNNSEQYSGLTLLLGAFFFAFQIYGDFSGYSDIAIGTARLFGFNLMQNFAFPYFSRDIAEFWRRWHISLSTWFRDYVYIPLGGSRGGTTARIRNTMIIFVVSGFWHGANWTFIAWGALNALYFLPLLLSKNNRKNLDVVAQHNVFPNFREIIGMTGTFLITLLAWVFFRAENITHAFDYLGRLFKGLFHGESIQAFNEYIGRFDISLLLLFILFISVEWLGRRKQFGFEIVEELKRVPRYVFTLLAVIVILTFMATGEQNFIYFQF